MKKERLLKVVERLRQVRVEQAKGKIAAEFNMSYWGKLVNPGTFKNRKNLSCVTAACAIGHCGTLFKAEGFKLVIGRDDSTCVVPVYQNEEGYDAVAKFFGIDYSDAEYLFSPGAYRREESFSSQYNPTPTEVAERIENFVYGIA